MRSLLFLLVSECLVFSMKSLGISSDFYLDIDGVSIAPGVLHVCALEAQDNPGGKLRCWGEQRKGLSGYLSEAHPIKFS
jgi:hypothetical protein